MFPKIYAFQKLPMSGFGVFDKKPHRSQAERFI